MQKTSALTFILTICLSLVLYSPTAGQGRISYLDLANRSSQQSIYIDTFTLPETAGKSVRFVTTFRIDYSFLPFRKMRTHDGKERFFSTVGMNMEVFKAAKRVSDNRNLSVRGLESAGRAAWRDTAYADTYEQTQSKKMFTGGYMEITLEPGLYNYMLQLNQGEATGGRNARIRQVEIRPYDGRESSRPIYVESLEDISGSTVLPLMNFGQNVYYGKDFYSLSHIPDFDPKATYTLKVQKVDISAKDTTARAQAYSKKLEPGDFRKGVLPEVKKANEKVAIKLNEGKGNHTYALVQIPNSTLPNSTYRLSIVKNEDKKPISSGIFRSLWIEMPTSLLNLDVAIDMLRFIVSDSRLAKIKSGSKSDQERKFRQFWEERDPTPKTEYNELMAEYYRRIDYAYEQFTTPNTIGYESDRGEIYIKYGPPKNRERTFPAGEPAVEIWTYENRRFVFRATSGFGDFRLVNR